MVITSCGDNSTLFLKSITSNLIFLKNKYIEWTSVINITEFCQQKTAQFSTENIQLIIWLQAEIGDCTC